jgi:hypothetical protein
MSSGVCENYDCAATEAPSRTKSILSAAEGIEALAAVHRPLPLLGGLMIGTL